MTTHEASHEYHMVEPSPWPALAMVSVFLLASGLIMLMHDVTPWVLPIGLIAVLYTMFVWFRDVVKEATHQGDHTPVVQIGLRHGMALFIASEVMFFVAWFWAFFNAAIYPTTQMGGFWPPEGIELFNPFGVPLLNTAILLSSGVTVTFAHHALRKGDNKGLVMWLWVTVALGISFTGFQAFEYMEAPFSISSGIYGTTFFMATGFHGFHVIVGTIFLGVCLYRAQKGHFTPDHHFGFEAAAWYWHFVDVVWLFLFTFVYWWTSVQPGAIMHGG